MLCLPDLAPSNDYLLHKIKTFDCDDDDVIASKTSSSAQEGPVNNSALLLLDCELLSQP